MKITSIDKEIKAIFESGYYLIPRFQRPYSWARENVEEFWNDSIVDNEGDYFIGSVVVFHTRNDSFGIVDGQQRFTTITMTLCSLRNILKAEGFDDLANGIHYLIERPDINNKPQFVLQTETSYPYLQEHIQKFGDPEIPINLRAEEENLKSAFDFISGNLQATVDAIKNDPSLKEEKKKDKIRSKLIDVRDKTLKLKIIFLELDNEDDAYIIFETLNTRGKDLTVSDLVKSHLTKLLKPRNVNVDLPKDKWNRIVETIEGSQADLDTDSFLHHFWLSKYEYLTLKKLYKSIKREVKKNNAKEFLDTLEAESHTYRGIHETTYRKWEKHEYPIKGSFDSFILFRVKQQLPMIISLMRDYSSGNLKIGQVIDILKAIENFHFMFTAVTSQRSSGGISQMYAAHARQLLAATTPQNRVKVLRELKGKLQARVPVYQEFEANFQNILFSNQFTKQKKLVQYILAKIDAHHAGGLPVNYEQMTIEHLASQNSKAGKVVSDSHKAMLGNLILVDHNLNNKLGNKTFADKQNVLKGSRVWLDSILLNATTWGEKQMSN